MGVGLRTRQSHRPYTNSRMSPVAVHSKARNPRRQHPPPPFSPAASRRHGDATVASCDLIMSERLSALGGTNRLIEAYDRRAPSPRTKQTKKPPGSEERAHVRDRFVRNHSAPESRSFSRIIARPSQDRRRSPRSGSSVRGVRSKLRSHLRGVLSPSSRINLRLECPRRWRCLLRRCRSRDVGNR